LGTKEKLDKKIENIGIRISEKISCIQDFDDEKEIKNFSDEFNIDINTAQQLFYDIRMYKRDKKDYQMLKYIAKHSTSGVSLREDIVKAKAKIQESENVYHQSVKNAKFESFVSEIPAQKVGRKVIGFLKENQVDDNVINKAVNKYASEVVLDSKNDEQILSFLYENNYQPQNNTAVDIAYKYFLKSKDKEKNIENLELEITEIEDVIHRNINTIKALNMKLSYYEQTVPNMQAQIKECAQKAQNSVYNVKQLQKQAEIKEHTGFFKRMFSKVKFFFKKDKPLLLSASLSGIQSDISAVTNGLVRVGNSFVQPESNENIISNLQKQKNMTFGFRNMGEPIQSR
jgi:hypothetical protein